MTTDWNTLLPPLMVILIPVLVNYGKKLLPATWTAAIPALAVALAPVLDWLASKATSYQGTGWKSLLIGVAAVGFREVVNQVVTKPLAKPSP